MAAACICYVNHVHCCSCLFLVEILEAFSKIMLNEHGLHGSSKVESRMLERKAISSFEKGMFAMFTRVSSHRILCQ